MDNLSDPHLDDYLFEKRGDINKHIAIYHGYREYSGIMNRIICLTWEGGDIIGDFRIEGGGLNHQFDSGCTNDMHISIDDNYQGNGYTKIMIKHLVDKIYEDIPDMVDRGDQILFIDADASDGFWDKIGMVESKRYGYNRNPKYADREGAGYEKYITINKLYGFAKSR